MKKIKKKSLLITLAVIVALCAVGVGAYFLFYDPAVEQKALLSDYTTFTRSSDATRTTDLLEYLHDEYVANTGDRNEERLLNAVDSLSLMDDIALNLSTSLRFGTTDLGTGSMRDDIASLMSQRQRLLAEINKAINNLADSTEGMLIDGYVRIFRPTAEYVDNYASLMAKLSEYIADGHYQGEPPAHIAVFNLYFDAVSQCYGDLEPTQSVLKPAHYNAMTTIENNVSIDNGTFEYNASLSHGQFSAEAQAFVTYYYQISNRYAYAGAFYEYYDSRMSVDDPSATAQERATYYLSKVW